MTDQDSYAEHPAHPTHPTQPTNDRGIDRRRLLQVGSIAGLAAASTSLFVIDRIASRSSTSSRPIISWLVAIVVTP